MRVTRGCSDTGTLVTSENTSGGGEYAGVARCSGAGGNSRPCDGPLSSPLLERADDGENGRGEGARGGTFPGKYRGINGRGPDISGLGERFTVSIASRSFSRFALLRRRMQILMNTVNESTAKTPIVLPIATANVVVFLLEEPPLVESIYPDAVACGATLPLGFVPEAVSRVEN